MRKPIQLFWMEMAQLYATRATCKRRKCGAIFVNDNRIVAAGYNSSPSKQPHCEDVGCLMVEGHCKRCNHAERAAIDFAANQGIRIDGCYVYISGGTPCITCAHGLIATRTRAIYVDSFYPDKESLNLLKACNVQINGIFQPSELCDYLTKTDYEDEAYRLHSVYRVDGNNLIPEYRKA